MKKLILMSLLLSSVLAFAVEPEKAEEFSKELDRIIDIIEVECPEVKKDIPLSLKQNSLIIQAASAQKLNPVEVVAKLVELPRYASVASVVQKFDISARAADQVVANHRLLANTSNVTLAGGPDALDPCIPQLFKLKRFDLKERQFLKVPTPRGEYYLRLMEYQEQQRLELFEELNDERSFFAPETTR